MARASPQMLNGAYHDRWEIRGVCRSIVALGGRKGIWEGDADEAQRAEDPKLAPVGRLPAPAGFVDTGRPASPRGEVGDDEWRARRGP